MDERAARRAICETARDIWVRGLGAAADGNLSIRVGENRLVTTPSGCHKGRLQPDDIVVCDLDGKPVRQGKPSSEIALHVAAYHQRSDIGAVIHAHPPMATAFSLAGGQLSDVVVSEVIFAFGQTATAPYTTPTTQDVPRTLAAYFACYDAVMMARHGSVTLGRDLDQAFIRLDAMEHTARICVTARMLGGGTPLPDAEVDRLYRVAMGDRQPPYRQPGNACPPMEPDGDRQPTATTSTDDQIVRAVLAALSEPGTP